MKTFGFAVVALGLTFGATSSASASTQLQMDIQAVTASFEGDAFNTSATGDIVLSMGNASLEQILIKQSGGPSNNQNIDPTLLRNVNGQINLVGGEVVGGFLEVTALLETDSAIETTYYAQILPESGKVTTQAGQGWMIDGLSFNGVFSHTTFAGVDVSTWVNASPVKGSFLNFGFNPNQYGVDNDAGLQVWVVVPTPAAAIAGLPMLGLLGLAYAIRRRRLNAA